MFFKNMKGVIILLAHQIRVLFIVCWNYSDILYAANVLHLPETQSKIIRIKNAVKN